MKYIVYQTINVINNKIYIGVHKTKNPDIFDGYVGCGCSIHEPNMYNNPKTPFQFAVKKYGINNFKRTILKVFDNIDDAYELEHTLVNKEFVKRKDTYNIALGGNKGNYYYPINQFDKEGNLIKTWDNMQEAAEAFGVSHTSINNAKLHKGSSCGYLWATECSINAKEYSFKERSITYKYNLQGELLEIYSSLTEAAHANNQQEKTVYRSIKSGIKCMGHYYSFEYCEPFTPKKLPEIKGKYIYIYDLQGNYLTKKFCGQELKQYFNINSYGVLKQAILNEVPYKGKQVFLEYRDNVQPANTVNTSKQVGRFDTEGNLLETFDSIRDATRKYGSGVYRVLKGQQKITKGYIFQYI